MIHYIIYTVDGRIKRHGMCQPETLSKQAWQDGEFVVEDQCDDLTDYIRNGMVEKRPISPVTLTGQTLSNVPVPAVVVIDGTRYDCTDDHVELDLPYQKTYAITVEAFPYLDANFTLTL